MGDEAEACTSRRDDWKDSARRLSLRRRTPATRSRAAARRWRAVLPHAIANRLAAIALQNIPYTAIDEQLLSAPSGRLIKSFSRRLGYLHVSKEAKAIVKKWLGEGGLLENISTFNDLGKTVFVNVAPVAPEDVLSALERTCAQQPTVGEQYFDLLRSIAYEPAQFVPVRDIDGDHFVSRRRQRTLPQTRGLRITLSALLVRHKCRYQAATLEFLNHYLLLRLRSGARSGLPD